VRTLLTRYGIRTAVASYREHNEARMTPRLVERLTKGEDIALVSDAGTPLISDPGQRLVAAAIAAGVRVVPIPGPSAVLAALVASGIDTATFTFVGFLPRGRGERQRALEWLSALPHTSVLFESPARLATSLQDLASKGMGERRAAVARELTKQHEEIRRGTVAELGAYYDANVTRGEVVIVLQGAPVSSDMVDDEDVRKRARDLLAAGGTGRDVVRALMKEFGIARNRAYQLTQEGNR
jgi:16S rRNA (cytidine1402-2'-O)-methyltransferase